MSVNPNKNKMNTNGMMRYVFNIFSPFSNDDCSSSKPSRIVSVCWTYYINSGGYLQEFLAGDGRAINKENAVSVLCQSDRHFLAFSDTTRNERHRKYN